MNENDMDDQTYIRETIDENGHINVEEKYKTDEGLYVTYAYTRIIPNKDTPLKRCYCCGSEVYIDTSSNGYFLTYCRATKRAQKNRFCIIGPTFLTRQEAIDFHNMVADAVSKEKN